MLHFEYVKKFLPKKGKYVSQERTAFVYLLAVNCLLVLISKLFTIPLGSSFLYLLPFEKFHLSLLDSTSARLTNLFV